MTKQEALFSYTLRLGDNALILGHRLSEWSSKGPLLEEDIAMTNMALDLIGRADAMLKYAAQVEGKGRTEDDLAYKRGERQFLCNLIVQLPNGDFGYTIARQLIMSAFDLCLYEELVKSKDETIAAISAKAVKEVKYHLKFATDWTLRLGDGTEESHQRIQKSFNDIWMYTGELFEMNEVDAILIKEGIAVDLNSLKARWKKIMTEVLLEATLTVPADAYMQTGSRKGVHTENLGYILAEMQYLQRAYPDAKW
ncbi:MAG: phenylacetate-CoA oxygenase subunit PaaC [Bacteroidetes bacterium]|nr:phenylacetate-CoA oxygenase subunit PaaC [Bacteroidota bacterium]